MKRSVLILYFVAYIVIFDSEAASTAKKCNCVCGVRGREQRIVGGKETLPNEFPWVAALYRQSKLYCSATIISSNFLLTAAHCVSSFEPNEIRVFIGGHNISKDFTEIKRIKTIIAHDDFDIFTFNNDIALIELESPVMFGPRVQPACLPKGDTKDFAERLSIIYGWGRTAEKLPVSQVLRSVVVPIWTQEQCLKAGYGTSRITKNMMCAGYHDGEKDACQGDSGGSMIMEGSTGSMEAVGIVSWGRGCARPNLPGIYTRVVNYLPWLRSKLKSECVCDAKVGQRTNYLENMVRANKV